MENLKIVIPMFLYELFSSIYIHIPHILGCWKKEHCSLYFVTLNLDVCCKDGRTFRGKVVKWLNS